MSHAGPWRVTALTSVLALALGSCTAGQPASPGAADVGSQPDATEAATVDTFAHYDEALVREFEAEGLSEGQAIFLALTRVEVEPVDERTYRIIQTFPTGNTADMTVAVTPDQTGEPGGLETSYTESGDGGLSFSLTYFVPYDAIPDDVEPEIRTGSVERRAGAVAMAGTYLAIPLAAPKSGVRVVVDGVVDEASDAAIEEFLEFASEKSGAGVDKLFEALKAGKDVLDALVMSEEFEKLQKQIDAIEECAENPTNPTTRNAYEQDPGLKQRLLEEVARTRFEVKANLAAMFIGLANKVGSGLTGAKWLAFVVGPLTSWTKEGLDARNAEALDRLRKEVTSCEEGFALEVSASGYRHDRTGWIGSFEGEIWGCPTESGELLLGGTYTQIWDDLEGTAHDSEFSGYLVGPPNQPFTDFTLVTSLAETWEQHVAWDLVGVAEDTVRVSGPPENRTAELRLVSVVGVSFQGSLEVVPSTPECEDP